MFAEKKFVFSSINNFWKVHISIYKFFFRFLLCNGSPLFGQRWIKKLRITEKKKVVKNSNFSFVPTVKVPVQNSFFYSGLLQHSTCAQNEECKAISFVEKQRRRIKKNDDFFFIIFPPVETHWKLIAKKMESMNSALESQVCLSCNENKYFSELQQTKKSLWTTFSFTSLAIYIEFLINNSEGKSQHQSIIDFCCIDKYGKLRFFLVFVCDSLHKFELLKKGAILMDLNASWVVMIRFFFV